MTLHAQLVTRQKPVRRHQSIDRNPRRIDPRMVRKIPQRDRRAGQRVPGSTDRGGLAVPVDRCDVRIKSPDSPDFLPVLPTNSHLPSHLPPKPNLGALIAYARESDASLDDIMHLY